MMRQEGGVAMRLLVTNDDGLEAVGLRTLASVLRDLGHTVTVVAPAANWSGRSQSVSLGNTITARRQGSDPAVWVVDGSPADCVRVAEALMPEAPEVVLAGVNHGANLGADVYRSGTVGAAREAVLAGWPAVALSAVERVDAAVLERHLPALMALAREEPHAVINVNLPPFPAWERMVVPVAWTAYREVRVLQTVDHQNGFAVHLSRRLDAAGTAWTDVTAVMAGYVAVSLLPVGLDRTEALPVSGHRLARPSIS
jgi:5'-nucleotidase